MFPGIRDYFDTAKQFALNNGYILTNSVLKRRRWVREFKHYRTSRNFKQRSKLKGAIERQGMNTPIQGTGGDMMKTAMVSLRKRFQEYNEEHPEARSRMVNVVHDEVVAEAHEDHADPVGKIVTECMEKAGSYYVKSIPMEADYVINKCWQK